MKILDFVFGCYFYQSPHQMILRNIHTCLPLPPHLLATTGSIMCHYSALVLCPPALLLPCTACSPELTDWSFYIFIYLFYVHWCFVCTCVCVRMSDSMESF